MRTVSMAACAIVRTDSQAQIALCLQVARHMTATTMAALLTRTAPMDATAAANKVTLVAAVRCPLHALLPEIAVTTAPPLTRTELMDAIAAAMEVTRALRVLYLHHVMRRSIAVVKATPPTQTAQMVANATALKDFQVPNAKQRFAFRDER